MAGSLPSNLTSKWLFKSMVKPFFTMRSYWHRIHQLPGIHVCPYHNRPLSKSYEPVNGKNRQRIVLPLLEEIEWEERVIENSLLEKKLIIASRAKEILDSDYKYHDPYYTKKMYISTLIDRSLAYGNGMIKKKEVKARIIDFWGSELLFQLGLSIKVNDSNTWVDRIFNSSKIIVNPLAHIIICEALQLDLADLLNSNTPIKDYMTMWEEGIISSASEGLSLRDIAKKNNTTRLTIKKVIERREIDIKWESNGGLRENYTDTAKFKGLRENKRKEFLNIIKDKPDLKVSHFRREDDNLYSWLQRYDKEWYEKNNKFVPSKVKFRMWEERDKQYLPLVKEVIEGMKKGYPIRITYNSVGGALGITNWLYSRNMVKTTAYLVSQVEKLDDFWIRRLKWAIRQLDDEIIDFSKWDIINISGIDIYAFDRLKEYLPELKGF